MDSKLIYALFIKKFSEYFFYDWLSLNNKNNSIFFNLVKFKFCKNLILKSSMLSIGWLNLKSKINVSRFIKLEFIKNS